MMTPLSLNLITKFLESSFDTSADFLYGEESAMGYEIVTDTFDNGVYYNAAVEIFEEGYVEIVINKFIDGDDEPVETESHKDLTTLKQVKQILKKIM